MDQLFVAVGFAGVGVVLVAYGLLASGRIVADSARYQWLNVIGTAGILISLIGQWNLAAFIANVAWIAIGLFSLVRLYRKASLRANSEAIHPGLRKKDGLPRRIAPRNDGEIG